MRTLSRVVGQDWQDFVAEETLVWGSTMKTLTVTLELPRDLVGVLDAPPGDVEAQLRELIALALYREGRVSSGKAAELIGISKLAFVQLAAQHGLNYFTESPAELSAEVDQLGQMLDTERA